MYGDKINKKYISLMKKCAKNLKEINNIKSTNQIVHMISLPDWCFNRSIKDEKQNICYFFITLIGIIDYQLEKNGDVIHSENTLLIQRNKILNDCNCIYQDKFFEYNLGIALTEQISPKKYEEIRFAICSDDLEIINAHELGYTYSKFIDIVEVFVVYNRLIDELYKNANKNNDRKKYVKFNQKIKQLKKEK